MKQNYCRACGLAFAVLLSFLVGCQKNMRDTPSSAQQKANVSSSPKDFKNFVQVNLTADNNSYGARNIDASLINAWGIDFPASGNIRVVAEGSSMSNLYTFDGDIVASAVSIPSAGKPGNAASHPTGNVCNQSADFKLPNGNPAQLIYASSDGALTGWNSGASAVAMVDKSPSASYLGIAIATDAGNNYLYAANFRQGKIDVYDKDWNAVSKPFTDPNMPVGYSPFNIQNIDGKLYVTYAKLANGQEETGSGKGYINVFTASGVLEKRFASQGKLNAPWGIVRAPDLFWGSSNPLPNMILVANFGDGRITVFDENGTYAGQLHSNGRAIEISGLWGIAFPPPPAFNNTYLYFAAGPNNESDGLFGYIKNAFIN